jgi:hypothetical protein
MAKYLDEKGLATLWARIKNYISTTLGLSKTNYGGTAAKATADANGNNIANTYATKNALSSEESARKAADALLIPLSQKGAAGGVATLDDGGKVPAAQLPSYLDDILEYDSLSDFPEEGESGKIYVSTDTNRQYRWSGTQYTEISESLALGETSSTAYRGDRGKAAYDHISNKSNPHGVTKSQVGLGNVDNTSDANKPVSTATQEELDKKVDKVSGKGLSTNDFTNTYKSNVDANTSARHTHSNKETLDATTAPFTTELKSKLDGISSGANKITVDSALSSSSTNPVQNKVVKAALDGKQSTMTAITDDEINALS